MIVFAAGKISHWFDWETIPLPPRPGLAVPGDPAAFRKRRRIDEVRMSLGGWQAGVVVEPAVAGPWQLAYDVGGGRARRCRLVLDGPVRVLRGPDPATLFGLRPNSTTPVPLRLRGVFRRRRDRRYRHLALV